MDTSLFGNEVHIDFNRDQSMSMDGGSTHTRGKPSGLRISYTLADPDHRDYLDIRMQRDPVMPCYCIHA